MVIIVYAFTMGQFRSIGGARVTNVQDLNKAIERLIGKCAQVLSIRVYRNVK